MSLIGKIASKNRVRKAARALALDPSAKSYVALAREHVIAGSTEDVQKVCNEGLQLHPGNADLRRLSERARALQVEERVRVLQAQFQDSPRPAVARELCEALLEAGRVARADEVANTWEAQAGDIEARYWRARATAERYYADRHATDGQLAYDLAGDVLAKSPHDPRPLQLQLDICSRAGAFQEARRLVSRLLEIQPGDAELEARFRSVMSRMDKSRTLEDGLRHVERYGVFADDEQQGKMVSQVAVRPMLRELSAHSDVLAAVYVRGGTALVQGPRGATADRTARAVRDIVNASRGSARRLGMGSPVMVSIEGDFGSFLLTPGDQGASALWCKGAIKRQHSELLEELSGMAGGMKT